ncbi:RPM1-interacting protein 4-like [Magnolia sinica]|uniref:RPM1-interacting protein 4-like n=1 Tax=Magnolia sinica TaxID=86752 RepID=UPI00265990AE|nr:RPM1-interacting protein 4-like [Magnolia sinica]
MAQRSHVPKFGNWESEENVPYTAYFDKARKGRDGKLINPNDPQYNSEAFSDNAPPVRAPPPAVAAAPQPKHERKSSKEDGEVRRLSEDSVGRRASSSDSPHQRDRGVNSGRGNRSSADHSPLHPHYQAKIANKDGVSSPSWERKGSSERSHGFAPNTPGRSRLRPATRGDESPEKGAAVPKFGDWDENNPASADGYTHIFNKVREEKQIGSAKVPIMPTESSYHNGQKRDNADSSEPTMCWCFPMGRK